MFSPRVSVHHCVLTCRQIKGRCSHARGATLTQIRPIVDSLFDSSGTTRVVKKTNEENHRNLLEANSFYYKVRFYLQSSPHTPIPMGWRIGRIFHVGPISSRMKNFAIVSGRHSSVEIRVSLCDTKTSSTPSLYLQSRWCAQW